MVIRLIALVLLASLSERGIEAVDGRPINHAAEMVLWVGGAFVFVLYTPLRTK